MEPGRFIISLDYELNWGVFDSIPISRYGQEIRGVHSVLPQMLDIFQSYDVRVTVAVVGLLLCKSKEEIKSCLANIPGLSPAIVEHVETIGEDFEMDPYHYDSGVLRDILDQGQHEIASHSFTHMYCTEKYGTIPTFRADSEQFKRKSESFGFQAKSFVFPRNQISRPHIGVLEELGFTAYRGNPTQTFHRRPNDPSLRKIDRLVRLCDGYWNVSGDMTNLPQKDDAGLTDLSASLFLRPVKNADSIMARKQFNRIARLMD